MCELQMTEQTKTSLKVTQASLNQTALDWSRNMANIYAAIDEAVDQGSDILALEELALTGYEANDEFQRTDNNRILTALDSIALYAKALDENLIISIGHPWRIQMRDEVTANADEEAEQTKNPLYDRMNLPFNVQTLISGGAILGMTAKANLFNDERGYEKRYFNEWSTVAANQIGGVHGTIQIDVGEESNQRTIPFGRPIIHVTDGENSFNLAQAICEEKWVATKYDGQPYDDSRYDKDNPIPAISRYLGNTDGLVLVIPNASPPARDKMDKHTHLINLASKYADAVIDTDGLGSSGSTFAQFGHRLIAQGGKTISYGARMSFGRMASTTSTIQVTNAPNSTKGKAHASLKHTFNNSAAAVETTLAYDVNGKQEWDSPANPDRHYEEVIRYTAFWLFDYMRKTGAKGIMEALSGGADSAFNSVIVSVMVHMAIDELGAEKFCDELNLPNKKDIVDAFNSDGKQAAIDKAMEFFLTGVYMGTSNSSTETRNAAEFLMKGGTDPDTGKEVKGIGGKFLNRNVQDLLDFYGTMYAVEDTTTMNPADKQKMMSDIATYLNASPHSTSAEEREEMAANLKKKYPQIDDLATAADGVAYENIQARGREVLIMLFANKENKMAVANPNLDEARNAYATFGGDLHSGTINLNAHLPKAYQMGIMRYLHEHGVQGAMEPVRALGLVLKNKPTAELLPKDEHGVVVQHDEDALQRSFEQMDAISEYMLYERKETNNGARRLNAGEVFEACKSNDLFENVDDNTLYNMVRFSYNRWTISQHKIHASPIAPTFGRNVDHQTSQRTPNINGQSKDELTLLAIDLLFKWAQDDGLGWSADSKALLERRAWQDERFIKKFDSAVWSGASDKTYDLEKLYGELKSKGWDGVFEVLDPKDPIRVVHDASKSLTLQ